MKYTKDKTALLKVVISPLDKARLQAEAKDAGTDLSKWVRVKLGIEVIGTVNSETGRVTLIQADGERIPVGLPKEYVGHDTGRE